MNKKNEKENQMLLALCKALDKKYGRSEKLAKAVAQKKK